jgi:hypothetical protein
MMKRVRKPTQKSETAFKPQSSQFASRPFASKAVEHEAPMGESRVRFSLADIDIFPRETVQPKLRLGPVGDRYEQEAGTVSSQGRFGHSALAAERRQDKPVPNRTGMPDRLKAVIESLSGIDMSDVRVHANSDKPAQLNALAYTQGNQILLGPGQGKYLPHEAWHVVQQKQWRVRATRPKKGVGVNDEARLEAEADTMGMRAFELDRVSASTPATYSIAQRTVGDFSRNSSPVQRAEDIYNVGHYRDPVKFISQKQGVGIITEDSGSEGLKSAPYMNLIEYLSTEKNRESAVEGLTKVIMKTIEKNNSGEAQSLYGLDVETMKLLITEIQKIKTKKDAASFVNQRSLTLSKMGPALCVYTGMTRDIIRRSATQSTSGSQFKRWKFHRDAGFLKMPPEKFNGGKTQQQTKALHFNGPFERGVVRGHLAVDRMEHRYIEHVHVNKRDNMLPGDSDSDFDIYNGTEQQGRTAINWADGHGLYRAAGDTQIIEGAQHNVVEKELEEIGRK